jgi:thiamine monophosphate synthase
VSRAVHGHDELTRVGAVDAIIAGTVRATPSKAAATSWLGLDGLGQITSASTLPVFAIGGVTAGDWPALAAAGAMGIAAIGWFLPRAGESAGDAVVRAMHELAAVV